jgi:hypothetical protein
MNFKARSALVTICAVLGVLLGIVPAGAYTITAWHEKLGISEQKITVSPNESKKIEFVFKSRG